jgi:hypothetical protein
LRTIQTFFRKFNSRNFKKRKESDKSTRDGDKAVIDGGNEKIFNSNLKEKDKQRAKK